MGIPVSMALIDGPTVRKPMTPQQRLSRLETSLAFVGFSATTWAQVHREIAELVDLGFSAEVLELWRAAASTRHKALPAVLGEVRE